MNYSISLMEWYRLFQREMTIVASRIARREVHYSGQVQGVGFRYTTKGIAGRFHVSGYVRNLTNGRVQLVVEGEQAELDRFLCDIETEMTGYLRNVQVNSTKATHEFAEFEIRS